MTRAIRLVCNANFMDACRRAMMLTKYPHSGTAALLKSGTAIVAVAMLLSSLPAVGHAQSSDRPHPSAALPRRMYSNWVVTLMRRQTLSKGPDRPNRLIVRLPPRNASVPAIHLIPLAAMTRRIAVMAKLPVVAAVPALLPEMAMAVLTVRYCVPSMVLPVPVCQPWHRPG